MIPWVSMFQRIPLVLQVYCHPGSAQPWLDLYHQKTQPEFIVDPRFIACFCKNLLPNSSTYLYIRGAIKKFSAWPSSDQNKIKIVFASYSSKAQNMACTIWLLSYKYFVHFSVFQMVSRTLTKLCTSFWRTSRTIPTWPSKNLSQNSLFRNQDASICESEQQNMQCNEQIGQNCHFITLHNSVFSISTANNWRLFKCMR